jgi:hypothetical protein
MQAPPIDAPFADKMAYRLRDGPTVTREAERFSAHGGASVRRVPAPTARSRQDPRCYRTGSW